jgi:hypothetical protein
MRHHLIAAWSLLLLLALALPPADATAQAEPRCFPETGLCIAGRLREFWEANGGLPVFGYPITAQQAETVEGQAVQVQWFERHRLELHPANPPPYDVLLGRLGAGRLAQQGRDWHAFAKADPPRPECRHFAETGQDVCGDILTAWRANGLEFDGDPATRSEVESLALFGLPLSGVLTETIESKPYQVQWFERARFELHPENQPPHHVLLGLLGREIRTAALPPAPGPTPSVGPEPLPPPSPYDGVWTVYSSFVDDFEMVVDRGSVRLLAGLIRRNCRIRFEAQFSHAEGRLNGATFFVRARQTNLEFALTGTFSSPKQVEGTGEMIIGIPGCRETVGFKWEGAKRAEIDRPPPANLDGLWKGGTARGEAVTFTVKDSAIVSFQVQWNRQEECLMVLTTPIPIVNRTATIRAEHALGTVSMFGTFRTDSRIVGEGSFAATRNLCRQSGHRFFEWDATKQE